MALTLTLDASVPQLVEPGFWRNISTGDLAELGDLADSVSNKAAWWDPATHTVMLKPRQFDPSWLNSSQQHDSIIHLDQMTVAAADTASFAIRELPVHGNNANPFIFHNPVGAATAFPAAFAPEFPGSAPSLTGISAAANALSTDDLLRAPNDTFEPLVLVHPSTDVVTPVAAGTTSSGKFIANTPRLSANQAVFIRWFHPRSDLAFPCRYEFYIAQFKVRILDTMVEVFRDTSHAGDRTAFKKIGQAPLFGAGSLSTDSQPSLMGFYAPHGDLAHDRQLFWLPYRRNQVLLLSSAGKWMLLTVNGKAKRLADDSDWDITRSDSVLVWVLTPAPGRFQIQKVKYPASAVTVNAPTIQMDYTPTVTPTITLAKDSDHGSTLTSTLSTPPSYTLPVNDASQCATQTTSASDKRRKYGIVLNLQSSGDARWTPFFYGFQMTAARTFAASAATPTVIDDSGGDTGLVSATLTAGLGPGEGRLHGEVVDVTAFPLSAYYYRASLPLQLKDGATTIFTGYTEPTEVTPITEASVGRRLTFSALDRWKQLKDSFLRDQRDWTTFGHIDVVKFIAEQAGVDCTSAEFPAAYTPNTINATNSALGGRVEHTKTASKLIRAGWQPRDDDSAATYIERITKLYSGWYVGFRLDGTFFYLPREYYTSPTVVFHSAHAASTPRFYNPVTFTTREPEANVILVKAGDTEKGNVTYSSLWIDWASILNSSVVNYLGRWRAEIVQVGGGFTCPQLNWIARTVWQQTRRRRLTVSFQADFVPSLKVGGVCTLGSYGNYRITGFTVDLAHPSNHRATYSAELVEKGYGL